jgi:methylmalonyl-CoA mutase C-terminal domain/subunit
MEQRIRVLMAKVGLDGHDVGVRVVARALRDAGMEVIYTGLRQRPEVVTEAAVQEDVDVLGISMLSGAHMTFFPRILEMLREKGGEEIMVIGGGVIPIDDIEELKRIGVREVFLPGTSTDHIVNFIKENVRLARSEED